MQLTRTRTTAEGTVSRDAHDASDAELVARVLDGEVEAFASLVRRYHGQCLRYAQRVLGDQSDAEDAVQEAFINAYDSLARYEERARFGAWLFAIVANACRASAHSRRRRMRLTVVDDLAVQRAVSAEPVGEIDTRGRLDHALAQIEPRLREAFLLRHVEGLSYEEMRGATGAGVSALKMRVKRACEGLRAFLEER